MVDQVNGLASIRGYRGQPKGDLKGFACAVACFSLLAQTAVGAIIETGINPLIVGAEGAGVAAVDGLIVLARD